MCFYDNFLEMCKERGVSPSRALIEAGLSKSLNSKWANNPFTTPNGETLTRLAAYFGCPVTALSREIILAEEDQAALCEIFENECQMRGITTGFAIVQAKIRKDFFPRLQSRLLSRPYLPDIMALASYLQILPEVTAFLRQVSERSASQETPAEPNKISLIEDIMQSMNRDELFAALHVVTDMIKEFDSRERD